MGRIPAHFGATALIQLLDTNSLSHHCFGTIIANIVTVRKKQMISNVIMKTVLTPQTSQNSLGESQGSHFENQPIQGKFILIKLIYLEIRIPWQMQLVNSVCIQPIKLIGIFQTQGFSDL